MDISDEELDEFLSTNDPDGSLREIVRQWLPGCLFSNSQIEAMIETAKVLMEYTPKDEEGLGDTPKEEEGRRIADLERQLAEARVVMSQLSAAVNNGYVTLYRDKSSQHGVRYCINYCDSALHNLIARGLDLHEAISDMLIGTESDEGRQQ